MYVCIRYYGVHLVQHGSLDQLWLRQHQLECVCIIHNLCIDISTRMRICISDIMRICMCVYFRYYDAEEATHEDIEYSLVMVTHT